MKFVESEFVDNKYELGKLIKGINPKLIQLHKIYIIDQLDKEKKK